MASATIYPMPFRGRERHMLRTGLALVVGLCCGGTAPLYGIDSARSELVLQTGHDAGVWTVAFSAQGRRLASGSADGTIKFWDVDTGLELRTIANGSQAVESVAFSPDGRTLAFRNQMVGKEIKLWDLESSREILTLIDHGDCVRAGCIGVSPDGSIDRKSTRLNSSHLGISYAVF